MTLHVLWLRRDLRLHDNTALSRMLEAAAAEGGFGLCCFCFDREILDRLETRADRRVHFIYESVMELKIRLEEMGSLLYVLHGEAAEEIPRLASRLLPYGLRAFHAARDYEPRRLRRDRLVAERLEALGIAFHTYKDHVLFEKDEIENRQGKPFQVYTPYRKAWLERLSRGRERVLALPLGLPEMKDVLWPREKVPAAALEGCLPLSGDLADIGFLSAPSAFAPGRSGAEGAMQAFKGRLESYAEDRDRLDLEGPSRLSPHLRFGTLSLREVLRCTLEMPGPGAAAFTGELIWREFFNALLWHFPETQVRAFKPELEGLAWDSPENLTVAAERLAAWKEGRTGFPLVDAGMRELAATGYMRNRARMVTASFLTKDLHLHWKYGERFFAALLLDYDLSQNLGNWQWAAGTGADAQPFFRIFNPASQSRRFDPEGAYIRRYCPELEALPAAFLHEPALAPPEVLARAGIRIGRDYPAPLVDHAAERLEALRRFEGRPRGK